jgi:hypothetical protein
LSACGVNSDGIYRPGGVRWRPGESNVETRSGRLREGNQLLLAGSDQRPCRVEHAAISHFG